MQTTVPLYGERLAALTDLYELTMANTFLQEGLSDWEAVFSVSFRTNPFKGGYAIAAGLSAAVEWIQRARFTEADLACLHSMNGNDGRPLFPDSFLDYLAGLEFRCDVDALPEGTLVFPHEPLLRVKGPIIQAQLLETALLNLLNSNTLWVTKAARMVQAADGAQVVEGGLRRAQGIDGALSASRCAFIGGFSATSNLLAGQLFGIPVKGTLAHSLIMAHDSELQAFEAAAAAMPNNCLLIADTYDSLTGVRNAAAVGRRLRERGYELAGIRLDSGDLAWLSIEARRILDQSGLRQSIIVASNELDEYTIAELVRQRARIDCYMVGTKYVTCFDKPALGGIYKLNAVRKPGGRWDPRIKISSTRAKTSIPGCLQIRRYTSPDGMYAADQIFDEFSAEPPGLMVISPEDEFKRKLIARDCAPVDLLQPVFRSGELTAALPDLNSLREHVRSELSRLHPAVKRLHNPHEYPAGLSQPLHDLRQRLASRHLQTAA